MQRRDVLRAGAIGLAGAGLSIGGLVFRKDEETRPTGVSIDELELSGDTTTGGSLSDVEVNASGEWAYTVPNLRKANRWRIRLEVTDGAISETVTTTGGNSTARHNSGEYAVSGSITDTSVYTVEDFTADAGETKTHTVGFSVTLEVHNRYGDRVLNTDQTTSVDVKATQSGIAVIDNDTTSGEAN